MIPADLYARRRAGPLRVRRLVSAHIGRPTSRQSTPAICCRSVSSAAAARSTGSARPQYSSGGSVPGIAVPSQPSRRLGPGNRHVSETLSPGSVSAIMSFPGRPQVSALCRCWRSWRRRLGGRPAGQRVDLLPLLPRRDRPVATRAAGPASEGGPCNCIGNAGRTVRGGGALPAAQLRCLGVTHEMLVL